MPCGDREIARNARLRKKRSEAIRKANRKLQDKLRAQIEAMKYLCGGHTKAELIEVRQEVELIVEDRRHRWGYVSTKTYRPNDGE